MEVHYINDKLQDHTTIPSYYFSICNCKMTDSNGLEVTEVHNVV